MQDKLKQYVEEHREEFELHEPRASLWDGVEDKLQHRRKGFIWQRLAIAASILLVVTCGTWIFIANRSETKVAETDVLIQSPVQQAEVHFAAIMQMKDAQLEQYCKPQPELCREFEHDMGILNKAYLGLKTEYTTSADKQTVLKAMMANLQMQVQLISQQLQIMESVKQKKEQVNII